MTFDVLQHPTIFSAPRRLTGVTAWHGLIPVAFALTALHRPKVFVELGTHKGDSYCAFCQAVDELKLPTRCYAVDTWQGDLQAGFYGEEVYQELCAYHDPLYGRFSTLLKMTFDEALAHFAEGEIDLLHIDGLHTYEAVKHDFESWLPKMSSKGVVILHDVTVHQGDFGVFKLWQELCQRYPTRLFGFSHGLGIIAVGQEALHGELRIWFTGGKEQWARIELFFAALGERLTRQDQIKTLQAELDGCRCELAAATQKIAQEHQAWQCWSEEKSQEITKLQAALQEKQTGLEQAKAALIQQEEKLKAQRQELAYAQSAAQTLEQIQASWLWRSLGCYLLPVWERFTPVALAECTPITLPGYIWPKPRQTLGGMRRFLAPLEVFGDRVAEKTSGLIVKPQARLLVRFDSAVRAAKVVLKVAGEQAVRLWLEFGELAKPRWHPLIRQEVVLFPGRPRVLYLRLPQAAETMALVFLDQGSVSFAQIALIAISPLECQIGPWLWPLQQGAILLRSQPWRRLERAVKRYGWRGAWHVARQRLGRESDSALPLPVPKPATGDADPYGYMNAEAKDCSLLGRQLAVLASSGGNFFMREIGFALAQAAEGLGAEVVLADERAKIDLKKYDWVLVIAPHEFFTLGKGVGQISRFSRESSRLLLVNTEQPQTHWFRTAWEFFPAARAVLDINYQTAIYLRQMGIQAYFLPLGYAPGNPPEELPEHPAFGYLPNEIRKFAPKSYPERPLDVVFVGTASPRRKAFFARHAQFFAGLETFIYLPEGDRPFLPGDKRALDFAALSGLIRRAKIVLNIHRDEHPYLEWQRIVNLGILQQTVVLSERCDFCPALHANRDYLSLPLDLIPTVCTYYLAHLEEAERFALEAFTRLQTELAMDKVLACLFSALEAQ